MGQPTLNHEQFPLRLYALARAGASELREWQPRWGELPLWPLVWSLRRCGWLEGNSAAARLARLWVTMRLCCSDWVEILRGRAPDPDPSNLLRRLEWLSEKGQLTAAEWGLAEQLKTMPGTRYGAETLLEGKRSGPK